MSIASVDFRTGQNFAPGHWKYLQLGLKCLFYEELQNMNESQYQYFLQYL